MANKYYVQMRVSFCSEIVADSQAQAEEMAYSGWGENSDALIQYDGVYDINVDDLGECCSNCEEVGCTECEEEGEDDN